MYSNCEKTNLEDAMFYQQGIHFNMSDSFNAITQYTAIQKSPIAMMKTTSVVTFCFSLTCRRSRWLQPAPAGWGWGGWILQQSCLSHGCCLMCSPAGTAHTCCLYSCYCICRETCSHWCMPSEWQQDILHIEVKKMNHTQYAT